MCSSQSCSNSEAAALCCCSAMTTLPDSKRHTADTAMASSLNRHPLFDQIGSGENRSRNSQTECLSGLRVNQEFELCGPCHGQIGGFGPLEDTARIFTSLAIGVCKACAIAHQSTRAYKLGPLVNGWNRMPGCQPYELLAAAGKKWVRADKQCFQPLLSKFAECSVDVALLARRENDHIDSKRSEEHTSELQSHSFISYAGF